MIESPTIALSGMYRDVLYRPDGTVLRDAGWQKNAIVGDFRRLLAAFVRGAPSSALGIQGLAVGAGLDTWDVSGPPPASASDTALVDPNPYVLPRASLAIDFLSAGIATATPTNRLQIVAIFGPGFPSWPDPNHTLANLREFGLMGELDGVPVLLNRVTHPVISKDPTSTLERTLWLVF